MIATSHVIIGGAVGIAIGSVTKNPAAALPAGVISHLVCDLIPHLDTPLNPKYKDKNMEDIIWTKGLYIFAIADSIVAFITILFLWNKYFQLSIYSPFAW